jgi:hypothetical protein
MKEEYKEKYLVKGHQWWECHELLGVKSLRMRPPYAPLHTGGVSGLVSLVMEIRNQLGPGPLKMVELGSWAGESSCIFAASGLFGKLWLVDLWHQPENEGVCEYNMRRFGASVEMVQGDMFAIGADWSEPLDVVYLDADHSYESTVRALDVWQPHIRPGGIMAGHDYNPTAWPGVVRAVDERFAGRPIMTFGDTSWAVRLPVE